MRSDRSIPITVIIVTKNEERRIARVIASAQDFSEIIVVDSASSDKTQHIAKAASVRLENFIWDGRYPKKRQWTLENIQITHDWVLWLDADEILTRETVAEIRVLFTRERPEAGFFLPARYIWGGRVLRFGQRNNKVALMHRKRMAFPVVDDLDIPGMGEIEGHYQPVRTSQGAGFKIGRIIAPILHDAYDDPGRWFARHAEYAAWEAGLTHKSAWPQDPVPWREAAKVFLRTNSARPWIVFVYGYFWRLGFLDGAAGLHFARSRMRYAAQVIKLSRAKLSP